MLEKLIKKEVSSETVLGVLRGLAQDRPDTLAIQSVSGLDLDFNKLATNLEFLAQKMGLSKSGRVALVFPQGIEMAMACLTSLSYGCIAPLNPAYTKKEFEFYFSDIKPDLFLSLKGFSSAGREVAQEQGIPVAELFWNREKEMFDVEFESGGIGSPKTEELPKSGDTALVLHTSGTTSRPKLVPLTQKNLVVSAFNMVKTLQLGPEDKCLNLMPLFHIHGLVVTLASLFAGGSVINAPQFRGESFFEWLRELQPTWYTGAPTLHQEILKIAPEKKEILEKVNIRKIRSSSSPMPAEVLTALEETFGAVVAESYGMTEAALQITSNQLPPGKRKAGSAGQPDGLDLAIIDENKNFLPQGETGEVVIKGDNITAGYENNDEANKENFFDGWFRTGDLGYLDEDGFLFLKGRVKEMINRGGENISPREVDEAMLRYSEIEQAVAFSMPHPSLGEEVAAAIILKQGSQAGEKEIRDFLKGEIAEFKIPKKMWFVKEIPKTSTGKLKRVNLYQEIKKDFIFENLSREQKQDVIRGCLKVAVCLENKNNDPQEYQKKVVEPYNKVYNRYLEAKEAEEEFSSKELKEALEMLKSVMETKQVPQEEQETRWREVFSQQRDLGF